MRPVHTLVGPLEAQRQYRETIQSISRGTSQCGTSAVAKTIQPGRVTGTTFNPVYIHVCSNGLVYACLVHWV